MVNKDKHFKDHETFIRTRNRERKRYYNKTSGKYPQRKYTAWEDEMVLHSKLTDTELSKELCRSVQSIQVRRCRLKAMKRMA